MLFSEHLMVTGGATQALIMLCSVFFKKGGDVYAEEPMSPKEMDIMRSLGLNIIPGTDAMHINFSFLFHYSTYSLEYDY